MKVLIELLTDGSFRCVDYMLVGDDEDAVLEIRNESSSRSFIRT